MTSLVVVRAKKKGSWGFSVGVRKKGSWVFCRSEVRNLGVRVERADMRWVGARRKKSTQVFELIYYLLVWMGCFVLGPKKQLLLVQWRHSTATQKTITTSIVETLYCFWLLLGH